MPGALPPVIAELVAETGEFSAKMAEAKAEMDDVAKGGGGSFSKLSSVGKVALEALGGAAVVVGGISLDMADKFETSQAALKSAIDGSGKKFDSYTGQISKTQNQMQMLGFDMADTDSALATLTVATQNPTESMKLMGDAADLARIKHESLADAAASLAKIEGGSTRVLTQLGINLDIGSAKMTAIQTATEGVEKAQLALKNTQEGIADGSVKAAQAGTALATAHLNLNDAELKLKQSQDAIAVALDAIGKRTHDAAKMYGETLPGQLKITEAEAENLATRFGMDLVPVLEHLLTDTKDIVDWVGKHKAAEIALGLAIGGPVALAIGVYAVNAITRWRQSAQQAITTAKGWLGSNTETQASVEELSGVTTASAGDMAASMETSSQAIVASLGEIDVAAATTRAEMAGLGTTGELSGVAGALSGVGKGAVLEAGGVSTVEVVGGAGVAGAAAEGLAGSALGPAILGAVAVAAPAALAWMVVHGQDKLTASQKKVGDKIVTESAGRGSALTELLNQQGQEIGYYLSGVLHKVAQGSTGMSALQTQQARDSTLQSAIGHLDAVKAEVKNFGEKYGTTSAQEVHAIQQMLAAQTADSKLVAQDGSVKGVDKSIAALKLDLANLTSKDDAAKALDVLGLSNAQLRQHNAELQSMSGKIATDHQALAAEEQLKSSIEKGNTEASQLRSDVGAGLTIRSLPSLKSRASGSIQLVIR